MSAKPSGPYNLKRRVNFDHLSVQHLRCLCAMASAVFNEPISESAILRMALDKLAESALMWPKLQGSDRALVREELKKAKKQRAADEAEDYLTPEEFELAAKMTPDEIRAVVDKLKVIAERC